MKLPSVLVNYVQYPGKAPAPDWANKPVRMVLVSEPEPVTKYRVACQNCQGMGRIFAFHSVETGDHVSNNMKVVSTTWKANNQRGWEWHYGEWFSYPCPVCDPNEEWYQRTIDREVKSKYTA